MLDGLITSLISVLTGKGFRKWKLKKTFGYLQGDWAHFSKDHERLPSNKSTLTYTGDRKLEVRSTTKYGNWHGEIEMSEKMLKKGAGYFLYDDKDEGGDIEIFVKSNHEIWVYPQTQTHEHQKTNFYIWKREEKNNVR